MGTPPKHYPNGNQRHTSTHRGWAQAPKTKQIGRQGAGHPETRTARESNRQGGFALMAPLSAIGSNQSPQIRSQSSLPEPDLSGRSPMTPAAAGRRRPPTGSTRGKYPLTQRTPDPRAKGPVLHKQAVRQRPSGWGETVLLRPSPPAEAPKG